MRDPATLVVVVIDINRTIKNQSYPISREDEIIASQMPAVSGLVFHQQRQQKINSNRTCRTIRIVSYQIQIRIATV